MNNDLVSVIMLSRDKEQYVEASVRSVMTQTYQNWELLFVDDASKDKTISLLLELKDEDRRRGEWSEGTFKQDGTLADRISVSSTIERRGAIVNRNSALRSARGRWIAFLDAGDIWEPTKLEKQVAFMEENGYSFSYTKYNCIDVQLKDTGIIMGGPECITYHDMLKCCWMGCLTVMYDAKKIGTLQVNGLEEGNDYALWLEVAEEADCHLLPECLASMMLEKGMWYRFLSSNSWSWRYEVYRKIVFMNPLSAAYMTVRNMAYATWKWWKYKENRL